MELSRNHKIFLIIAGILSVTFIAISSYSVLNMPKEPTPFTTDSYITTPTPSPTSSPSPTITPTKTTSTLDSFEPPSGYDWKKSTSEDLAGFITIENTETFYKQFIKNGTKWSTSTQGNWIDKHKEIGNFIATKTPNWGIEAVSNDVTIMAPEGDATFSSTEGRVVILDTTAQSISWNTRNTDSDCTQQCQVSIDIFLSNPFDISEYL